MTALSVTSASPANESGADNHPVRVSVPALLNIDEAALVLTVSRRTLCQLLATGRLKSFTVGRRRIIRRADLEKYTGQPLA